VNSSVLSPTNVQIPKVSADLVDCNSKFHSVFGSDSIGECGKLSQPR